MGVDHFQLMVRETGMVSAMVGSAHAHVEVGRLNELHAERADGAFVAERFERAEDADVGVLPGHVSFLRSKT